MRNAIRIAMLAMACAAGGAAASDFGFGSSGSTDFGLGSSEGSNFGFGQGSSEGGGEQGGGLGGGQQAGGAMAEPACAQVICLMNEAGQVPPGCMMTRQEYFSIQVWSPYYNSSATKEARGAFISSCTTARQSDIQQIQNKYGESMMDPGT